MARRFVSCSQARRKKSQRSWNFAHEAATPIVPQGGNTGLVGGQNPGAGGRAAVLSLTRMRALREIDPASNTMTVEAGMVLADVQAEASRANRLFPLSLGSEGSCTIGGNLSTNAGGTNVIAYGNARDLVLGLEVVLADGRILSDLSKLKKNNTGYDLKNLFIGSEGTLGIITAAVLKLFPKPQSRSRRPLSVSLHRVRLLICSILRAIWRAARSPVSSLSRASASISFWRILIRAERSRRVNSPGMCCSS